MTETAERSIRLAVQSNRRLMRDALVAYLAGRPEFTVVGQTASVESLYPLYLLRRPDVTLVDAGALTVDLVESLQDLRETFPSVEVLIAYTDLKPPALHAAIRAGLTGLVPSTRGLESILRVLRQRVNPVGRTTLDGLALTDRELEVVSLLGAGHSVPEMAEVLRISPRTVENHKRHLYAKLGVGTQSHAVSRATSLGLLPPAVDAEFGIRSTVDDGGERPVVVAGERGPCLDEVVSTLVGRGLAVRHAYAHTQLGDETYDGPRRMPGTAVLVNPQADDWLLPAALGIPAVVVHSADPNLATVVDALLRGAQAMLRSDQVPTDLTTVLSLVARGYFAMRADRMSELTDWICVRFAEHPSGLPELTARERDILASIARGHTVRQTARALGIAAKTVENTQARLFRKLGARNRAGALTMAYRLGLLDPTVGGQLSPP